MAEKQKKISKFLKVKLQFDLPLAAVRTDRVVHLLIVFVLGTMEQSLIRGL